MQALLLTIEYSTDIVVCCLTVCVTEVGIVHGVIIIYLAFLLRTEVCTFVSTFYFVWKMFCCDYELNVLNVLRTEMQTRSYQLFTGHTKCVI